MKNINDKKLGYVFVLGGVSLYAFSDAIMQYFMAIYGVNQVTFLRTIFRFIPLLIFAIYKMENPLKTTKIKENIFRSVLASLGTYFFMLAYKYTSMTDVIVIGYSTALFVIPMSIFILKEKLCVKDIYAVCIGFTGVVLSFRPGIEVFQFGIMYAVIAAVVAALNQVIIKKLSYTDSELTIIFYHHIVLILISLIVGFKSFIPVLTNHILIMFIGGSIGTVAQYCIIHAFKLSTCSNLASAAYIMLLPATLIDFFMYNRIPDIFIICGLILIICGSFIALKKDKIR